jgi:hypothetical protein
MADLKPLGSEKLQADDKLKRILELTYYNNNKKSSSNKAELVKESKNGGVFGIVKEKDGYYVKRGLNESSLDYIGGLFMKNKNKFSSYSEALKRLELLKGQEELNEAKKYILKQTPSMENEVAAPVASQEEPAAPAPVASEEPPAPAAPADEPPAPVATEPSAEVNPEQGSQDGVDLRSSYMEEIQKFAGKLGQELRDQHERLESDDIKYVLNMIISAVDLDKLSDEDISDIGKKFEREEEGATEPTGEEPAQAEEPAMEPSAEEKPEEELSENDPMAALDEFINSGIDEVDLGDYTMDEEDMQTSYEDTYGDMPKISSDDLGWEASSNDEEHDEEHPEMTNEEDDEVAEDEVHEIDLDEIKKQINQAISDTLSNHFK